MRNFPGTSVAALRALTLGLARDAIFWSGGPCQEQPQWKEGDQDTLPGEDELHQNNCAFPNSTQIGYGLRNYLDNV